MPVPTEISQAAALCLPRGAGRSHSHDTEEQKQAIRSLREDVGL